MLQGRDTLYEKPSAGGAPRRGAARPGDRACCWPRCTPSRRRSSRRSALRTGGRLRAAVSGGGALPPYVDEFFAAVGITLLEGYGLTETSPVLAARTFDRLVLGTVGLPIPGTEIRIVDEQGRDLPQGQKGIVLCRGGQVMLGYHKRPEETAKVLSPDGWFNTGDLGRFTIRGELSLTGRAKETIVLLGGENIEPAPIEDALKESPYLAQIMVVGQDKKHLGALIVPNFDAVRDWLAAQGAGGGTSPAGALRARGRARPREEGAAPADDRGARLQVLRAHPALRAAAARVRRRRRDDADDEAAPQRDRRSATRRRSRRCSADGESAGSW